MNAPARCDVVIVGFGPTGATLANLIGQAGLSVAVVEREPGLLDLPRAVHFDGEVMRIFQSAGLAAAILPHIRPSGGMRYLSASGRLLVERKPAVGAGPHGWANNYLFHQPDLEHALRSGLTRFANVAVHAQHEAIGVEQDAAGATVRATSLTDGRERRWRARYVVGCDGARSLVRQSIGAAHDDLGLHQPWLVVDVRLRRPVDLPQQTVQYCDTDRPVTFVNVTGDRRRWEIMLMPGDDPESMTDPEVVWRLLDRWVKPEDAELVRGAVYTFHSLMATRWRDRRLLIAGDAAHQTPPFLGQGMCAGIRDAANLAWKLALVARGMAPDALLDTYESERRPHVLEFIDLAVRLGSIIQTTDPEVAAARDRCFETEGTQELVNLSPVLGPGLHTRCAPAGEIFPQPRLADGRLLDEAIGPRFAVIGDGHVLASAARERWEALDAIWLADAGGGAMREWLQARDARAVVLRPDRYILGLAASAEALDALAGLLPHRVTA